MKSYTYYLKEQKDFDKVQWLKLIPAKSSVESPKLKELIKTGLENFYDVSHIDDDKNIKIDNSRPVLVYTSKSDDVLNKYKTPASVLYNKSDETTKSGNKDQWHKLLGDSPYLPKTTLDRNKISELEFPIIAKPAEGHSGVGIHKFDTLEEAEKELKTNKDLVVFSEMIKDIDTEYRFVFVKDKLFLVHERVPIIEDNKTISTKKPDESLGFLYIEQDMDKEDYDVKEMVDWFRKKIKMDFFALDIMLDKAGKYWIIESNSGIGMGGNTMARAYEAICKDYYSKDLPEDKKEMVEMICAEYYKEIKKMYPEEFKKSKNPKQY